MKTTKHKKHERRKIKNIIYAVLNIFAAVVVVIFIIQS